jgi:RNA polymerase I-specific transcription initiation factor RRN6
LKTCTLANDSEVPKFREVGPHHEWIAASHAPISKQLKGTWHENQKQKKWLLKTHPEAALGNDVLEELLALEDSPCRHGQTSSWNQTQFAIGEMTDISDPRKISGMPLLAMAAGSAGDVLRLLRPKTNVGVWHAGKDANLKLELLDHSDYQETLWAKDVGTIRRVQSVMSTRRFEPVRWLIVLRDFGTTIFRPEYRKAPVVAQTVPGSYPQTASHITPNPLFTLPKSQTGYESQSDVAFNVGIQSKPPQLALVDEGGNWSVWDITGTRNRTYRRPKPRLSQCGSIRKGAHQNLSRKPAAKPQGHRILWVGRSNPEEEYGAFDEEEDSVPQRSSLFPPLGRSSTLLLCNQKTLRLFDLDANIFLPDLHFVADNSNDAILDVHADAQDPRYFYVVTTSKLFVAAQFSTRAAMQIEVVKKSMILHSFPHFRARMDEKLKIAITPGPPLMGKRTSLVFLYSQNSSWYDVFCIMFSKEHPERVLCYHDRVVTKSPLGMNEDLSLQTLYPSPVLTVTPPGSMVMDEPRVFPGHQTRFFQLFAFGTDLSLSDCLGASSTLDWSHNVPSIERLSMPEQSDLESRSRVRYRKKSNKFSGQELERRSAIRYLSSRFVVADSFAESQYGNAGFTATKESSMSIAMHKPLRRMIQPIYECLYNALRDLGMGRDLSSVEMEIYGAAPFDPVYVALQTALETESLPLRTL